MNRREQGTRKWLAFLAGLLLLAFLVFAASMFLSGRNAGQPANGELASASLPAMPASLPAEPALPDEEAAEARAACQGQGFITLWHGLAAGEAAALDQVVAGFAALCPDIAVQVEALEFGQLLERFQESSTPGDGPDLILAPGQWTGTLAAAGQARNLSDLVSPETLQRFLPAALDAMRYDGDLYGLPSGVQTVALFYNRDLAANPPTTLDDLLAQAAAGQNVALNTSFYHAYWGVPAFGGQLFDEEGRGVLDQGGFARWLEWLKAAQAAPGLVLDTDSARLKALFEAGEATYYVDGPWALGDLQATLGPEQVGVAPLPAGPAGPAGPLLGVEGYLVNSASDAEQARLALAFAEYATSTEAQELLMQSLDHIPANATVDASARPAIAGFLTQALIAVPMPNTREMDAVWRAGNDAYAKVLSGLAGPIQAAAEATQQINEANGKY